MNTNTQNLVYYMVISEDTTSVNVKGEPTQLIYRPFFKVATNVPASFTFSVNLGLQLTIRESTKLFLVFSDPDGIEMDKADITDFILTSEEKKLVKEDTSKSILLRTDLVISTHEPVTFDKVGTYTFELLLDDEISLIRTYLLLEGETQNG